MEFVRAVQLMHYKQSIRWRDCSWNIAPFTTIRTTLARDLPFPDYADG